MPLSGPVGHTVLEKDCNEISTLKTILEAVHPAADIYYSRLRWILQKSDPVARFLHLYSILLALEGGANSTQEPVDMFIRLQDPDVEEEYSSFFNKKVTIYRQLRNEVAHVTKDQKDKNGDIIKNRTHAETQDKMEQKMNKLIEHVKVAISKLP